MESEHMKTGVVIPCHNYGKYLTKCLDSILAQTMRPDQIIVVDDSSTDNTREIVAKYPGVIYERVEFKHANKTRNYGAAKLKDCEFLLFFDADNYMHPSFIEKMHDKLSQNPGAAYAYCDRVWVNARGFFGRSEKFPEFDKSIFETRNFVDFASLMRREMYDSMRGLDEDFSALEDWDFFYSAANMGFYGVHIPEELYYYRMHDDSKSIYLQKHPREFQELKHQIIEKNAKLFEDAINAPSVSFVFAALTEKEAENTVLKLTQQRYRGDVEFCYSTEGTIPQALNKALAAAKNDVVVFVETDVQPHDKDWLRRLVSDLFPNTMAFSDEVTHTWYSWAGTACYRKDLHDEKLDESYPIAEDTEYFERLKKKHGLQMKRSSAVVYHLKEHETNKARDRAMDYGYLHAKLIEQYQYFPLEQYKKRLELQREIAELTLAGIKKYEDEKKS